ncbi:MAG: acetyl-CoA carboxylase biotin carboxyl carrier protein subunit [Chloroflexi bacterium]|nr:acetyl-CoA carboxylase biotin carboxyl carrier protein subunit [Chloroflexota bacterium]
MDLTPSGKTYRAKIGDDAFDVEIIRAENEKLDLLIDGKHVTAYVSSDGAKRWVTVNGRTCLLTKSSGAISYAKSKRGSAGHDHASELAAPMPGQIRAVNVGAGDAVKKGQTLLVLEAMKMEIRIQAPRDGIVSSISVKVGQTVEREQILIEVVERLES